MKNEHSKPKSKQTRRQRNANITRQKILVAAKIVFAEKGMDLTRIDEISERADIGKGSLYHHFSGKAQIIRELIKSILKELMATMEEKCKDTSDVPGLLNNLIGAHIEFFSKRWEDFVLYFQSRSDLNLRDCYSGIETPFVEYLECVESLLESVIKYKLPRQILRRIACAITGFVSGYYSFAAIASLDENIDEVFISLQGAMVASLERFIKEALPSTGPNGNSSKGI